MNQNNTLRLEVTDDMINAIYGDAFNFENYSRGWWTHEFFSNGEFKFLGIGNKTYIEFPDKDTMVMFALKFGVK